MSMYTFRRLVFLPIWAIRNIGWEQQLLEEVKAKGHTLAAVVVDGREEDAHSIAAQFAKAKHDSKISVEQIDGEEGVEQIASGELRSLSDVVIIVSSREYEERLYERRCNARGDVIELSSSTIIENEDLVLKSFLCVQAGEISYPVRVVPDDQFAVEEYGDCMFTHPVTESMVIKGKASE